MIYETLHPPSLKAAIPGPQALINLRMMNGQHWYIQVVEFVHISRLINGQHIQVVSADSNPVDSAPRKTYIIEPVVETFDGVATGD